MEQILSKLSVDTVITFFFNTGGKLIHVKTWDNMTVKEKCDGNETPI